MKIKHLLLIVLITLLITSSLCAQNYLFQNGQSGFHLKCAYSDLVVGHDEYNAEIGYTVNGRLTLGVNYWQLKFPTIETTSKYHFGGAKVDYLLIGQNKFPLSISVGMSYKYTRNIGIIELWEPGETVIDTLKLHEINLNIGFCRRFNLNTNMAIIPSISLMGIQRYISNSAGIRYGQSNTPYAILTLQTDFLIRSLDVFGGVDFYIFDKSLHYWNYSLGIGILLKHKTLSNK